MRIDVDQHCGKCQVLLAIGLTLAFLNLTLNTVEGAPTIPDLNGSPVSTNGVTTIKGNDAAEHGLALKDENIDKDVEELENLKPVKSGSMTMMKSHSSLLKSINGQKEIQSETQEEVNKNGKLLARIHQKMEEKDDKTALKPFTHVRTEIEIPEKNIHKVFEEGLPSANNKRKSPFIRDLDESSNFVSPQMESRPGPGVQFSPMDMAEYIFWVGDEKGVTMAIEDFLQEGFMTREEAINYLEEIKYILNYLQSHYADQAQRDSIGRDQPQPQPHQLSKNLDLLERAKQARSEASELMEVRQQLRDQMSKKNIESMESDPLLQSKQRLLQSQQNVVDDDYEDLLERLKVADSLYTEYSLEEIIYQLAKVMFAQSLTRGSSEAQDALEKFTRFLEAEAEDGRISRNLEKKVLDVLIASLTDTLTEHPELIAVARESLAMGSGNAANDKILQQLILNRGASEKTDTAEKPHLAMTSGSNVNLRKNTMNMYMLKERNQSVGEPTVMMKKSGPPPSSPNDKTSAKQSR